MPCAMCVAYYIPPGMAAKLIHAVDHTRKKMLFNSPDVFLAPFTNNFFLATSVR